MANLPEGFRVIPSSPKAKIPDGFRVVEPGPETTPDKPLAIVDVPMSFGSGVVRGAAETAMFPATVHRLAKQGGEYAADKVVDLARYIMGYEPLTDADRAKVEALKGDGVSDAIYGGQDIVRSIMDDNLYAPKTTAGDYAETVGEFAVPGGIPSRSTRVLETGARKAAEYGADVARQAVVPALISEGAGQATEDTAYEPWARAAAALTGTAGVTGWRASNAPEAVLRRAVGNPDNIDWARAVGLTNNPTGIRLTGPEAIAQAQGGGSALPDLLRVVEGGSSGRAITAPFFAARPGQVDNAVNRVLDDIAPQSPTPSSLGARASQAADNAIDAERRNINAQTRPLYQAAEAQTIPDAQFGPIRNDPRFQAGLERLRNNPELAPDYAGMPDNSVAVVDAVTKDMAARGEALANSANPLYGPELAARNTQGAQNARSIARGQVTEYDDALTQQAQLRRDVLEPLENGPLGRVAAANDTTTAGNAILPHDPLTGSQAETADAVTRLIMQDADTTRGLVRQNLADRYSKVSTETQEGSREFAGAKFRKDVAGNRQRDETLTAVLNALGVPNASQSMPELLDVLQATGRRKPIGSATEFNRAMNAELGASGAIGKVLGVPRNIIGSLITGTGDAVSRLRLRNGVSALADMFVDPNSVELIRQAIEKGGKPAWRQAGARGGAQAAIAAEGE